MRQSKFRSIFHSNFLFYPLLAIFIITPLFYLNYVPLWDGWIFVRQAYMQFAQTGSLNSCNHSAPFHTLLFGLTQLIDFGDLTLIIILNILLGILAILSFKSILKHLFGDYLSAIEINLITFVLGLNPLVLVLIVQPSLDLGLTYFFIFFLNAIIKKKYILASIFGIMMVLTKEPGFVIYGVCAILYVLLFLFMNPDPLHREKRILKTIVLFIPLLIFLVYGLIFPLHSELGPLWPDAVIKMFRVNLSSPMFAAMLASAYFLNFNWIIGLMIFIGILYEIITIRTKKINCCYFRSFKDKLWIILSFILISYFLTRIQNHNNPRYLLPILPLYIILFGEAISKLSKYRKISVVMIAFLLCLIGISAHRTIDPVSKKLFGTFSFGKHKMLSVGQHPHYYGRDELVYNYQFTNIHFLFEKLVQHIGIEKTYVAHPLITWTDYADFSHFNIINKKRTIKYDNSININLISYDQLLKKYLEDKGNTTFQCNEIYYVKFPNIEDQYNQDAIKFLSQFYHKIGEITVREKGYILSAVQMQLNEVIGEEGNQ